MRSEIRILTRTALCGKTRLLIKGGSKSFPGAACEEHEHMMHRAHSTVFSQFGDSMTQHDSSSVLVNHSAQPAVGSFAQRCCRLWQKTRWESKPCSFDHLTGEQADKKDKEETKDEKKDGDKPKEAKKAGVVPREGMRDVLIETCGDL